MKKHLLLLLWLIALVLFMGNANQLFAQNQDWVDEGSMQIYARTQLGTTITLTVDPSTTIEGVKQQIQAKTKFPIEQIKFSFQSKELEDSKTLADYLIQKESTIFAQLGSNIIIRLLGGGLPFPATVEVNPSTDTILSVKQKIQVKYSIPAEKQKLVWKVDLEDNKTLKDYNISETTTFKVFLKQ